VYARRKFCGNLEVCRPPEPLWNPRLREAATTLGASGRQGGANSKSAKMLATRNLTQYKLNFLLILIFYFYVQSQI